MKDKLALVDVSNVVRKNTRADAKEPPALVNGLETLCKALKVAKFSPVLIGDLGLWQKLSEDNPPVEALCQKYNDQRSLRLWRNQYGQCTLRCIRQNADLAILRRAQSFIDEGATPDQLVIVSNDGFFKYTDKFGFLEDLWHHDGPNYLCPFEIKNWVLDIKTLNIKKRIWR